MPEPECRTTAIKVGAEIYIWQWEVSPTGLANCLKSMVKMADDPDLSLRYSHIEVAARQMRAKLKQLQGVA